MFEYKGRRVQVDARKLGSHWDWTYRIDGGTGRKNSDAFAPTREVAEEEAGFAARQAIDAEERQQG